MHSTATMTSETEQRTAEARHGAPTADLQAQASIALDRAMHALYSKLKDDNHWCAELEGDSILNTEYLLMKVILGQHAAPEATEDDLRRFDKMVAYIRMLQREDGTWGQYPGSPPDISACVKAYFVLKLWGDDPDAEHMVRARERILALGGAERINTFSMFYLACLGQVSWDACPSIPPEIVLLPRWFPFHMTKVAAWTRTMILPLAICSAKRPVRRLPSTQGIGELFIDQRNRERLNTPRDERDPFSWRNIFLTVDKALKLAQKSGIMLLRPQAISRAEKWITERIRPETTDGLGAIFPPMVYIQIAFQALGYRRDHPVIVEAEHQLDRFIVEEDDHIRIQPCFSPVWDTGTALYAVTESGITAEEDERLARVCDWLCDREVPLIGDWVENLRKQDRNITMGTTHAEPGKTACAAWAFEYRNDWYPDVDDTAMVAMALTRAAGSDTTPRAHRWRDAGRRAVNWIIAMQNDDGGWAAFDRTTHREWMEAVPFADHNAMQDPSCADITGRTIESLITNGLATDHPTIRHALDYLLAQQRPDGSWWGRWGVNYIYGTWQAVGGLAACGLRANNDSACARALAWYRSIQNEDGGFGESANSYLDPSLAGVGPSTASQTAWAAIAMMKLVEPDEVRNDESIRRAIAYLCHTQLTESAPADPPMHIVSEPAGGWREEWYTGTGFPKVFYLRYHLYRHYFPVMALARYARLA